MPSILPAVNACLNATAALLLILGWTAIKRRNKNAHAVFMGASLVTSFLFLGCYLAYHAVVGVVRYQGSGISKLIYFAILVTHTPLAVIIVPFSLIAVYHALRGNFSSHTRITRWLFPVWVYVSITGVVIYFMLYRL